MIVKACIFFYQVLNLFPKFLSHSTIHFKQKKIVMEVLGNHITLSKLDTNMICYKSDDINI